MPLHVPIRLRFVVVPAPLGLNTWHDPGGAFGMKFAALKTPMEKSAPRTIATIMMAYPYVMRYSIADWLLSFDRIRITCNIK